MMTLSGINIEISAEMVIEGVIFTRLHPELKWGQELPITFEYFNRTYYSRLMTCMLRNERCHNIDLIKVYTSINNWY